jgi:hypothetical protein
MREMQGEKQALFAHASGKVFKERARGIFTFFFKKKPI